ncbi:MAG: hypothetical protein WCH62_05715 [Candidatus Omnitrophota bacterium]
MSIFNKLSDVLKEVFWIKPSRKKKTTSSRKRVVKKKAKKIIKKVKKPVVKPLKAEKPPKPLKAPKVLKPKMIAVDDGLERVGEITHYFDRIKVCVIKITQGTILIGDKLTIVGGKKKFVQKVWSMQIESLDVKVARKGQLIGVKVDKSTEVGALVYK